MKEVHIIKNLYSLVVASQFKEYAVDLNQFNELFSLDRTLVFPNMKCTDDLYFWISESLDYINRENY